MFDLEKAIKSWRRKLRSSPAFEDGDVVELESHLRDEIDRLRGEGLSDEEAFQRASEEIGEPDSIGDEMYKTRTPKVDATPPWKQKSWILSLLPNYFKTAIRNMYRQKGTTFINIFGLTTALLCCIMIFIYVHHELTYDSFYPKSDRIYRVTVEEINRPGARYFATSSPPMGPALVETYPDIEQAVRFRFVDSNIIRYEDRQFYEYDVAYADSTILTVFDFPLERGDPKAALSQINSVVLTHEMSQKYFGNSDPIGKSLILDNRKTLTVTGVFEPITKKTHLKFDCVISFDSFEIPRGYPVTLQDWGWVSFYTYVLLDEQSNPTELETKFPEFLTSHMGEQVGGNRLLHLQPLDEIYLNPDLQNANVDLLTGNINYVYAMSVVALFLLIIAFFNFVNLTTAHSIRRSKEVGVRKSLGANKVNLVVQFLGESILITFLSTIFALLLTKPFLKIVSSYLGVDLVFASRDSLTVIPFFITLSLFAGTIAGLYPAIVISKFNPSKILKGQFEKISSGINVRTVLVIGQFAIAVLLISGSLLIRKQIQFIQSKDLGFIEEEVLVLHMNGTELTNRYRTIKETLERNSNVISTGMGGGLLDGNNGSVPIFTPETEQTEGYAMNIYGVHFGYLETMGIDIAKGRGFNESFTRDSSDAIMLNEAAVRTFGWTHEEAIGKELRISDIMEGEVIGITKNFHFASLHQQIQPLVMYIPPTNMGNLFVRVYPGNMNKIVASLEETWQEIAPDFPFSFIFLDEHLNQLYQNDRQFSRLISGLTGLIILIACMGLFGLVTFYSQSRTKEIGIRKVLGASMFQIILLLSKRFTWLIVIANILAWPVAWYFLKQWLQEFAYQTELNWYIFGISGSIILLLSFLTMSFQSIKTALMNPINSLRSE